MTTTSHSIQSQGITLSARTFGHAEHTPVVLVHGYPDNQAVWEPVARILAQHYYVITYDVRGAGASDKPKRRSDYTLARLEGDLKAVVDSLIPNRKFHLAGHDWGSVQSWESATSASFAGRILSYTSISGPSMDLVGQWAHKRLRSLSLRDKFDLLKQMLASWYIVFFHLPLLPGLTWSLLGRWLWPVYLKYAEGIVESSDRKQRVSDARHGVKLYRANVLSALFKPRTRRAHCPVNLIVPIHDNYLGTHLYDDAGDWGDSIFRQDINGKHWVLLEDPETISQRITQFIDGVENGTLNTSQALKSGKADRGPLSNKIAVITGAGSGIGRATAIKLAENGATVICADIDKTSAERTVTLCTALGASAAARTVDVGVESSVRHMAEWVESEFGGADIVINNAGIGFSGGILDTEFSDWERVYRINLQGVVYGSRLFAQMMVRQRRPGHIVNTASAAAYTPQKALAAYASSKSAVLMLSECIRAELAPYGIGVSAVCPGIVATGIIRATQFAGRTEAENAVTQAKLDSMYKRRNLGPEAVAKVIYTQITRNRAQSMVGIEAHFFRLAYRLLPFLSRQMAKSSVV